MAHASDDQRAVHVADKSRVIRIRDRCVPIGAPGKVVLIAQAVQTLATQFTQCIVASAQARKRPGSKKL